MPPVFASEHFLPESAFKNLKSQKDGIPAFCFCILNRFLHKITVQSTKQRGISNMKATGIVRRIDDCGIITQRGLCRINTGVLLILSKN